MSRPLDKDITELCEGVGITREEYHKMVHDAIGKAKYNTRASDKRYTNSQEKLNQLKEKYKNGVSDRMIKEWIYGL